jgi:hypothetical protein
MPYFYDPRVFFIGSEVGYSVEKVAKMVHKVGTLSSTEPSTRTYGSRRLIGQHPWLQRLNEPFLAT